MPLLGDEDRKAVERHFSSIERRVPIKLVHPATGPGDSGAILAELSALSGMIDLEMAAGPDGNAAVISIGDHGRVQFWGTPSGYEFNTLLTAILDAGRNETRLSSETVAFLDALATDLYIEVFVTPTCPHCPGAAVLAHRMAAASRKVRARVIEAQEYPDLARANRVMGVPRTVVNGRFHGEGNMAEAILVRALSKAMAAGGQDGFVNLSEYLG